MATAAEFRSAAREIDRLRGEIPGLLNPIAAVADRPAVEGGDTPRLVQITMNAAALNVNAVFAELVAASAEARRRARICDEYAAAVQHYHRAGRVGPHPPRPASWVDL